MGLELALVWNIFPVLISNFSFLYTFAGLDKIEFLQGHENREIYQKSFDIIEKYFGSEDEDKALAPQVDENAHQYQFAEQNVPMSGFNL